MQGNTNSFATGIHFSRLCRLGLVPKRVSQSKAIAATLAMSICNSGRSNAPGSGLNRCGCQRAECDEPGAWICCTRFLGHQMLAEIGDDFFDIVERITAR